jgi:hypothetical protein
MAGLWCENFWVYPSIANMIEGAWAQADSMWHLSTANPPQGPQNIRATSTTNWGAIRRILGGNFESAGFAYRFYVPNLPVTDTGSDSLSSCMVLAIFLDNSAKMSCYIVLGTDGSLILVSGADTAWPFGEGQPIDGPILQRGEPCVLPAAYNHIEIYGLPAASDGAFEVRVNGVTQLNYSGDTIGSSDGTVAQVAINFGPAGVGYIDVGDMHTWNTLPGQGPQWFVGNAAVLNRALDADSSPEEWTPSSSGGPTYELLQDNNDSTYIEADVAELEEAFGAAAFPDDVIGVIYQQINFRGYKVGAGDCDVTPGVISGGILAEAAALVMTPQPSWYWGIIADDPDTSGAPFSVDAANASKLALIRSL